MLKWILLASVGIVVLVIAFRIIRVMWKSEKSSKNNAKSPVESENTTLQEYVPMTQEIKESSKDLKDKQEADFLTDFTKDSLNDINNGLDNDFYETKLSDSGFGDSNDDEFADYSNHMRNRTRSDLPKDFDIEGDKADDDFEYVPSSPEFSYLHTHQQQSKQKTLEKSLNELPNEIKALMISNLFDTKF